jgi:hypothetical protein
MKTPRKVAKALRGVLSFKSIRAVTIGLRLCLFNQKPAKVGELGGVMAGDL